MKERLSRIYFLQLLAIIIVAFILYWPSLQSGWVLDDKFFVLKNQNIRSLSFSELFVARGLTMFTFALNYKFSALDVFYYKIVNLLIHALNAFLFTYFFKKISNASTSVSLLFGLVFLSHPLQTSAVNYISQRMTILSFMFAIISLIYIDKILSTDPIVKISKSHVALAVASGLLSVAAKENTVLLPLAVPLLSWYRRRECFCRPALIIGSAMLIVPMFAVFLQFFDKGSTMSHMAGVSYYQNAGFDFYVKLKDTSYLPFRYFLAQMEVFWLYLKLLIFPFKLGFDYSWPIPAIVPKLQHVLTFLFISILLILSFINKRKYDLLFVGVVWILIFTALESTFIPLDVVFEHRMYSLFFGISLIVYQVLKFLDRRYVIGFCLLALAAYGSMTVKRNMIWADPVAFWQESCAVSPHAPRSAMHLAKSLFAAKRFPEAAQLLRRIAVTSVHPSTNNLLGEALYFAGDVESAMKQFHKAKLYNDNSEIHSIVFSGHISITKNQYQEALNFLLQAERKNPYLPALHYFKGLAHEATGEIDEAIHDYQNAINSYENYNYTKYANNDEAYVEWAKNKIYELSERAS